jgi:hypothetical protein
MPIVTVETIPPQPAAPIFRATCDSCRFLVQGPNQTFVRDEAERHQTECPSLAATP